jgi:hypothetical protein
MIFSFMIEKTKEAKDHAKKGTEKIEEVTSGIV